MTSIRPNKGTMRLWEQPGGIPLAPDPRRNRSGRWRQDRPFSSEHGLRIMLRAERGVTTGDVLRVPFRFQTPIIGEFTRPFRIGWTKYDTIADGQKSRPPGAAELLELSLETMLMDQAAADASHGVVVWDGVADPQGMIQELLEIAGKRPGSKPRVFRLVITQPAVWGSTPLVNMLASITAMTPTQRAGEVGTEYLPITFLEYDEGDLKRRQRPRKYAATKIRPILGVDTLHSVSARSHFNRASAWPKIEKENGIKNVSPSSASELAAWMRRNHRTELKIPARG